MTYIWSGIHIHKIGMHLGILLSLKKSAQLFYELPENTESFKIYNKFATPYFNNDKEILLNDIHKELFS